MTAPEAPRRDDHVGPARPDSLAGWLLHVDGLVARPGSFTTDDLARLGTGGAFRSGVTCPDGPIGLAGAEYEGVDLEDLIAHMGPLPTASQVLVHSGDYVASFRLESLGRRQAVLAFRREGRPLAWAEGGPVRLVVGSGACFDTVKWVERVELAETDTAATALEIIRARRAAHLANG